MTNTHRKNNEMKTIINKTKAEHDAIYPTLKNKQLIVRYNYTSECYSEIELFDDRQAVRDYFFEKYKKELDQQSN